MLFVNPYIAPVDPSDDLFTQNDQVLVVPLN